MREDIFSTKSVCLRARLWDTRVISRPQIAQTSVLTCVNIVHKVSDWINAYFYSTYINEINASKFFMSSMYITWCIFICGYQGNSLEKLIFHVIYKLNWCICNRSKISYVSFVLLPEHYKLIKLYHFKSNI